MNIFFIDFETTGLNPYHNDPIEIAIKKYGSEEYYESFIKPSFNGIHYQYVPEKITNITGITDNDIINHSKTPHDVIYNIIQFIKKHSCNGPIYILAHNGNMFDFIIFRKMIYEYNNQDKTITRNLALNKGILKRLKYIDTVLVSRLLLKDETVRQSNLCKKYNIQNTSEHRSLGDIVALEKIYTILCEQLSYIHSYEKNHYLENPSQLILKTLF